MAPTANKRQAHARGDLSSRTSNSTPTTTIISPNSDSNILASQSAENHVGTSASKNESLSSGPSAARSTFTVRGGRGSRGGRGGTRDSSNTPVTSRFRPKNVRRNATELAELAHKEEMRKAAVLAQLEREQARIARGRGRQRGRGDMMGRKRGKSGTASSIFGAVPESLKKSSGMFSVRSGGSGGFESSGDGSRSGKTISKISFKSEGSRYSESGVTGSSGTGANSYFVPQYPGEDEDTIRIDIEHINLISEDDDDDLVLTGNRQVVNKNKAVAKSALRPVRLHREEHKERATIVNTATTLLSPGSTKQQIEEEEEGLFVVDDARSSNYKQSTEIVTMEKEKEDALLEPRIKQESSMEIDLNLTRPQSHIPEYNETQPKFSPESKQRMDDELTVSLSRALSDIMPASTANPKTDFNEKSKKIHKILEPKPVFQTEEDRAEYERHLEDVAILANELGCLQHSKSSGFLDADGDDNMENIGAAQEEQDKKEGRLYLFQFPPALPTLHNPKTEHNLGSKVKIKQETTENGSTDQILNKEIDYTSNNQKGKEKLREVDKTASMPVVKLENEELDIRDQGDDIPRGDDTVGEEGFIGKLIVRESGRVELSWGGTSLLVGRGVDAGFLTTGVIVDSVERGPQGGGVPEGRALGMGQIMGKFVVTPDWKSMT